jgi:multidrug resistance efflux pump
MFRSHHDLFPKLPGTLAALVFAVAAPLSALPVEVEARLTLPAGAEIQIDSPASLPVLAIAEPNLPVRKTAILAQLDKEKLEEELEGERRNLSSAQAEKRRLATERGATSSSPVSNNRVDMQNAQNVAAAESAEQQALAEITALTTQIQQSLVRAPADGFLAKSLYAVGAKTKKRKPFLVFAEASKTVIDATVPATDAAPFTVGANVRLAATGGEVKGFTGKVVAATPAGDAVALRIQPLELPFFPLGTTQRLALSPM